MAEEFVANKTNVGTEITNTLHKLNGKGKDSNKDILLKYSREH
jgi:hypothetical protein